MEEPAVDHWVNDKFGRKSLAEDLLAFIDSVGSSEAIFGEEKSLVIGVDAPYGIGKTFFLRSLQLSESHRRAVAYVDAWADDIIDDPLISVAATIREAIEPWLEEPAVKEKWDETAKKAGKIAAIAGKGIVRQGLKLAISEGGVSGIEAVLDEVDDDALETLRSSVNDSFDEVVDNVGEMRRLKQEKYIDKKIADLESVRSAINALKSSLTGLADELETKGLSTPIIVIIDELDRCRPSYAIRMLEEIKHIFACPKVCFLLGINSDQLSKSMAAEYGPGFDGTAYLDRFVDRYFTLPFPEMHLFVSEFWDKLREGTNEELWFPQTASSLVDHTRMNPSLWLCVLLKHYEIAPRRVFKFFDRLRTSVALSGGGELLMPYLAELVAIKVAGGEPKRERPWAFYLPSFMTNGEWVDGDHFFENCNSILQQEPLMRNKALNVEKPLQSILSEFVHRQKGVGPEAYHNLLERVGHFSLKGKD